MDYIFARRERTEGGWEGTTLLTHLYCETQFISVPACAGYPTKQVKFHCILFVSISVLFLLVPVLLCCIFVCLFPCLFREKYQNSIELQHWMRTTKRRESMKTGEKVWITSSHRSEAKGKRDTPQCSTRFFCALLATPAGKWILAAHYNGASHTYERLLC